MRILTTADFMQGRIPRKEDFKQALYQFESDCVFPFLENGVVGSFAYGSVNRDDCNVASDIDYFMIVSNEKHKLRVREATKRAYEERSVHIQTRVIGLEHAISGFHGLDASFRQHLELSVKNYSHRGINPLEILADNRVSFRESLRTSMAIYLMKLNNGFTTFPTSEEQYVDFLKDIMEKPFHAMRVAIQHHLGSVAPVDIPDFHDTKKELIEIYSRLGMDKCLIEDIDKLKATAREYVGLLELRQRGEMSKGELTNVYSRMLSKIESCYPEAFHFIDENAKKMIDE